MRNPNPAPPPAVRNAGNPLEACWDLPAAPESVGRARQLARETLAAWGMSSLAEHVTTVVSELVTNAIVHAGSPTTLSLFGRGLSVRGEVADDSADRPTLLAAGPGEEHGRGLAIVAAYADRWGVEPAPRGKVVWFLCTMRDPE